ncbi:type IV conjugative transfer system lipoprotein TraV [Providencia hangzhouensis]
MNKLLLIVIPALLSGCAGMNSEFEFNKPAKDSGYWMQQADEMTESSNDYFTQQSLNSSNSGMGKFNLNSYKLINIANITLPIKFVSDVNVVSNSTTSSKAKNTMGLKSQSIPMGNNPTITTSNYDVTRTSVTTPTGVTHAVANCNQKRCYQEAGEPFVTPDRVQRVWLAPYVSPDNNVHVGEIVYFVSEDSRWHGME